MSGFDFSDDFAQQARKKDDQKSKPFENGLDDFDSFFSQANSTPTNSNASSFGNDPFASDPFSSNPLGVSGSNQNDPFGANPTSNSDPFGLPTNNTAQNNGFSNFGVGGVNQNPQNNFGNQQQPPQANQPKKDAADVAKELATKGGKSLYAFFKVFTPLAKEVFKNPDYRKTMFTRFMLYTGVLFVATSILNVFMAGVFNALNGVFLFSTILSVSSWTMNYVLNYNYYFGKQGDSEGELEEELEEPDETSSTDSFGDSFSSPVSESTTSDDDWGSWDTSTPEDESDTSSSFYNGFEDDDDDDFDDEDEGYDYNNEFGDDDEDEDEFDSSFLDFDDAPSIASFDTVKENPIENVVTTVSEDELKNVEANFDNLQPELVSRRLLLDSFLSSLDSGGIKADYHKEIEKGSKDWYNFVAGVHQAQAGMRMKEDDYIDMIKASERLLTYELVFEKGNLTNAQVDTLANELTKIVSFGDGTNTTNQYATAKAVSTNIYITLFKERASIVYLKDVIEQNREFFEDTNNRMPVTFGFDVKGNAILADMSKQTSLIYSGEGGSGKSNFAKVVIDQLIALNPPSKVQFLISDVKTSSSDWAAFSVPHVKRFESTPQGTLDLLKWVNDVEYPRRDAMLSAGQDINDYNDSHPDSPIPYLYVIADEMLAMNGKLAEVDKEMAVQYRNYIANIVALMRQAGIFFIGVPHRITDAIIQKTTSELIPTKFAIRSSAEVVKNIFGVSKRDFPYELKTTGDFCYTTTQSKTPKFGHAPVLAKNANSVAHLLDSQRKIWTKIEPEQAVDSHYYKKNENQQQLDILKERGLIDDSWADKFV